MKKKIIYLGSFIILILGIGIFIDQAFFKPTVINSFIASKIYSSPANNAFTDDNFYKCVVDAYNKENETSLPYTTDLNDEQLKTITKLSCNGLYKSKEDKIKSATGIEKLTALTYLDVTDNQLTELDVSKNKLLTDNKIGSSSSFPERYHLFNISGNQLTNLNLGDNKNITGLDVSRNQLTSLDVSKNTALIYLNVTNNQLTELDVSKNTALKTLEVYNNKLTNLDVSKNTALTYLYVYNNQLMNLDMNNNTALTNLNVRNNQLTELDVSKNTTLTDLNVRNNQLTELDVSKNTTLTDLNVSNNQLTELDVSNNTALTDLNVKNNRLTNLDVSKNISLIVLDAYKNQLTELDVSKNTTLADLNVSDNKLISLDVSRNIALTDLNVSNNKLTELDVSRNIALTDLNVSNNKLTELDVSKNTALIHLYVKDNQLTSLDVSNNKLLTNNALMSSTIFPGSYDLFDISNNKLINLNLGDNKNITGLDVSGNQLTSLDVSKNTALTYLDVSNNQLTSLDVSNNIALTCLDVSNNQLATSLVIYKGKSINLENGNEFIKLPERKTSTLTNLSNDNKDVVINDNIININTLGEYKVIANYKHDIYTKRNTYSVTYNIKVVGITGDNYKIDDDKEYIYTGVDVDNNTILNNINLYSECSKTIENNKLIIKYGDEVLKTFKIVNISSTKYDLSKEYIFDNDFDIDNIKVVNGTSEINNNQLLIKYEDVILSKYNLVSYNSTKYDLSKDSIKVLDNSIEEFINNIKCINCDVKIFDGNEYKADGDFGDEDKLRILYNDEVLKEYSLTYGVSGISLVNKKVKLNLDTKNSIKLEYTISPKNADNKEVTWKSNNTDVVSVDNNGVITAKEYGDAVITVTTVDGNYSETCDVNVSEFITYTITYKDGDKIYTEDYEEGDSVTWKSDITKKGYTLVGWKYNDKEYKLSDKFTMINEDITVTSIWNVNKYTITYEVNGGSINNKTKEVTYDSKYGTLEIPSKKGYSFKGWYKDNGFIDIVDEDTIVSDDKDHTLYAKWEINSYKLTINDGINTNEYTLKYNDEKEIVIPERKGYSFVKWNITGTDSTINNNVFKMGTEDSTLVAEWKLVIPEIKNYKVKDKYITGVKLNTNVNDFDLGLDSIYSVRITDKLLDNGLIGTGNKVNIYLDDELVVSYIAVVKGDTTGDGKVSVGDVAKLYQYLKKKITMEEHFVIAGNVVDVDDEIKVGDVAKLYQFVKGKISSLE